MNYLICDDEPAAAESLKAKIAELEPDSSVRIFTTLQALLFNIEDIADRIDGVFMDIKLRNANGISGAARLLSSHPEIKLVYITGYASEYIQELYCVDSKALPAAILTKPIEMKYLRNALSKIHEREKQARSREMNALAEQVRCEVLAAHEGTEDDVLLETPLSGTLFTGYTRLYIPVVVSAPGHKSGEIVHVRLGEYDGERVRAALC